MMDLKECTTLVVKLNFKFKTSIIRSGLSYFSDAFTLIKGNVTAEKQETAAAPNNKNKM